MRLLQKMHRYMAKKCDDCESDVQDNLSDAEPNHLMSSRMTYNLHNLPYFLCKSFRSPIYK